MKKPIKLIAMWDNTGLECMFNVTKYEKELDDWEKKKIVSVLKDEFLLEIKPNPIPLKTLIMRARVNSQRHYEIYGFTSNESEKFVRDMFKNEPQIIVDWIRENGTKIYSERVKTKDVVIV